MGRLVTCLGCGEEEEHYALGLCRPCYNQQYHRKWREANPEKYRALKRAWQQENRNKVNAAADRYRRRHPERVRVSRQKWDEAHPGHYREYQKANLDGRRVNCSRRRARIRNLANTLTIDEADEILTTGQCFYCSTTEGPFQLEHYIPLSKGGPTTRNNVVCACEPCNQSKGNKWPWEFTIYRFLVVPRLALAKPP